jgi:hypothetical protein
MKKLSILLALVFFITGCASKSSKPDYEKGSPGFLVNYDLLEEVKGPAGMQIYAYKNDDIVSGEYFAGIVEPVFIYNDASSEDGVMQEQIESAKQGINAGLRKAVAQHYELTDKRGPGVFRMQVAITGADLEGEGLKPWNIIPISAAIRLSTYATGYDKKRPVLMVEMKIIDSETDEIIKEIVTISTGDYFRNESNTAEEFENLTSQWVKFIIDYSNVFSIED